MKNRFIARSVALVVVLSVAVALGAAPAPERDPFKGKSLLITYNERNRIPSVPLEQAQVQKLAERYYIVGKVVDSGIPGLRTNDCTMWIPESSVTSIEVYESVEKMKDAYMQSERGPLPIGDPRRKAEKGRPSAIEEKRLEEKKK